MGYYTEASPHEIGFVSRHVDTITDLVPEAAGVVRYDARLAEFRAIRVTSVPASYKPPPGLMAGWNSPRMDMPAVTFS